MTMKARTDLQKCRIFLAFVAALSGRLPVVRYTIL